MPFANPATGYHSGRISRKFINDGTRGISGIIGGLSHQIVYHSGATEGIATFILGMAERVMDDGGVLDFFYSSVDHIAVKKIAEVLKSRGHNAHQFGVELTGDFDCDELIRKMRFCNNPNILLNFTYVNNESGVVWPLSIAEEIKEHTSCAVHVDAVQAPGKIEEWQILSDKLDVYTFSAHKFGALKGVGFSFVKDSFPFSPLLVGGGQQNGMRAGTENAIGIYSCYLALKELADSFDYDELSSATRFLEKRLKTILGSDITIAGSKALRRNGNTCYLVLKNLPVDILLTALDMKKIEVGTGPACSSGLRTPSSVLLSYGLSESEARNAIRLSFSPTFSMSDAEELADILVYEFLNAMPEMD